MKGIIGIGLFVGGLFGIVDMLAKGNDNLFYCILVGAAFGIGFNFVIDEKIEKKIKELDRGN